MSPRKPIPSPSPTRSKKHRDPVMALNAATAKQYRAFRAWLFSRRSLDSFRCAVCFCTGTLLCLLPDYPNMWFAPVTMANQITFTLLGGVSKPTGGFLEFITQRLGGGVLFSVPMYIILRLLGHQLVVQGIVYTIFVFGLSWGGAYNILVYQAALFAQTACTYAVATSVRVGGEFDLRELHDLLLSWAFGSAICFFINFFVFPIQASTQLRKHLAASFVNMQEAIEWLYSDQPFLSDPTTIHDSLLADVKTSGILHHQSGWEIAWGKGSLDELRDIVQVADRLRFMLATCVLEDRFYKILRGRLALMLQAPAAEYLQACTQLLDSAKVHVSVGAEDGSPDVAPTALAERIFEKPSADLTSIVISSLKSVTRLSPGDLKELNGATHCITIAIPLATELEALQAAVRRVSTQKSCPQFYAFQNARAQLAALRNWRWRSPFAPTEPANPFLPAPSVAQRIFKIAATDQFSSSLKVTCALLVLLSMAWAEGSRQFFFNNSLTSATVPLILALGPTLGGSLLAWIAELLGTFAGALWAALTMFVWRGVAGATFNVPGVIFFEFLFTLCFSWRLAWQRDDMLAVLACFALGAFINTEYQLRYVLGHQTIPLHLESAVIVISIAIGIAIPLQFLVMRKNARQTARFALAASMREVAGNLIESGALFRNMACGKEAIDVDSECKRLRRRLLTCRDTLVGLHSFIDDANAEWVTHDGFLALRFQGQISVLQRINASCDIAARIASMGLFDERVKAIVSPNLGLTANNFVDAASTLLWCHSAALSLLQPLPNSLPSVHEASANLLVEVEACADAASRLRLDPIIIQDVTRFFQLVQLLSSRTATLDLLADLLSVDWKPAEEEELYECKDDDMTTSA